MYGDDPESDSGEFDSEDDSIDPGHVQGVDYETPPKEVSQRRVTRVQLFSFGLFFFPSTGAPRSFI